MSIRDHCVERIGEMFGEPAILFLRKTDGHCMGYRRPIPWWMEALPKGPISPQEVDLILNPVIPRK